MSDGAAHTRPRIRLRGRERGGQGAPHRSGARTRPSVGYDRLARWYPTLERLAFGNRLQRARSAHFHRLADCRSVLLLGDGVGCGLEALVRRLPRCRFHSVDASPLMLQSARRRLERAGLDCARVELERAEVETWASPGLFDAVVTPFFLDLFEQERLESVVERIAGAIDREGHWLLADFSLPASGWRRQRAQVWLWVLYRFFRAVTATPARRLQDPGAAIERQGFRLLDEELSNQGLLMARCYRKG